MKKLIYLIVLALILGLVLTGCSLLSDISQVPTTEQTKVKPTGNLAGAEKVPWNLSADVMPVPPYGSRDILGSDTASKLIVNQPNGAVEVTITGVMNGLHPDTTYTIYLSKEYIDNTGWPGLFNYYPTFTFVTDADGSESWHINLRDSDFPLKTGTVTYTLSVWINEAGKTMLISENFDVEVSY